MNSEDDADAADERGEVGAVVILAGIGISSCGRAADAKTSPLDPTLRGDSLSISSFS